MLPGLVAEPCCIVEHCVLYKERRRGPPLDTFVSGCVNLGGTRTNSARDTIVVFIPPGSDDETPFPFPLPLDGNNILYMLLWYVRAATY